MNARDHWGLWQSALQRLATPGWRWLVVAPALVNIALFGTLSYFAWQWLAQLILNATTQITLTLHSSSGGLLPSDWLANVSDWLMSAAWLLFWIFAGTLYAFSFTALAQLVGAPFYATLAERVVTAERRRQSSQRSWVVFLANTLWRELGKLVYLLGRSLAVVVATSLLALLPVVGVAAPLLLLLWMCWAAALQYLDYAADADGVSFASLRERARQQRLSTLGFGAVALLCAGLPVVNLLLLPLTTASAALYWCRRYNAQ